MFGKRFFLVLDPFQYFKVPRFAPASWRSGRGGVASKTLKPGSVGADLMLSGVSSTPI